MLGNNGSNPSDAMWQEGQSAMIAINYMQQRQVPQCPVLNVLKDLTNVHEFDFDN